MPFPLLNLPRNVIRRTVRMMGIDGIICLSLASKRCKHHVIIPWAYSFEVSIQDDVKFLIKPFENHFSLEFPSDETVVAGERRKLKPQCFKVCLRRWQGSIELGQWKWTKFEYQDWLEHLWDIFHYRRITQLRFNNGAFLYDLDDIKKVFGKAKELYIEHTGCYDFNQLVLRKFSYVDRIRFDMNIIRDSQLPSSILIQNFNEFNIMGHNETSKTIKLNDLLMINSKSIKITNLKYSPKDMNKIIKLLIKGSNPRLECLVIHYIADEIPDRNEIMKDIVNGRHLLPQCLH